MTNETNCKQLDDLEALVILVVIIDIIIALVAIIGNSLVICSVIRFPNLRTNTNRFVVSLAVADLLVGLCIPYYVLFYFKTITWRCERTHCLIRYFVVLYPTISSMLNNIGVAVERYISIIHPLSYQRIMNTGWVVKSIVIGWIYVGIITALPLMGLNNWRSKEEIACEKDCIECDLRYIVDSFYSILAVGLHVFLTLIITLGLYYCIFREAWKQLRSVGCTDFNPTISRETKTSRMMVLVLGVCFLGLMPYLTAIIYPVIDEDEINNNSLSAYKKCAVCFYLGKSSVNPLIYGWKNRDFREAFGRLLKIDKHKDFYLQTSTNQTKRISMPLFTISSQKD